jgi:hypothetical protein
LIGPTPNGMAGLLRLVSESSDVPRNTLLRLGEKQGLFWPSGGRLPGFARSGPVAGFDGLDRVLKRAFQAASADAAQHDAKHAPPQVLALAHHHVVLTVWLLTRSGLVSLADLVWASRP